MIFIGDISWFYLQARDMLYTGEIPQVSIPSSHPWIHQGPFWTYLLSIALFIGRYSPVSGAVLAVMISLITVTVLFMVTTRLFSKKIGLLTVLLYCTSPLIIIHSRMPYHTTPIPLFTILYLYSVYLWLTKGSRYFPLIVLFLGILYNFELATVILSFHLIFLLGALFFVSREKIKELFTSKTIGLFLLALLVPLLPMLFYDVSHGFPQTLKFIAWLGYRALLVLGILESTYQGESFSTFLSFSGALFQRLLFLPHILGALAIFLLGFWYVIKKAVEEFRHSKKIGSYTLIASALTISVGAYVSNRVPSESYTPMLFPLIILSLALCFGRALQTKTLMFPSIIGVGLIILLNSTTLISHNYLMGKGEVYGPTLEDRKKVVESILYQVDGKPYTLKAEGPGSEFESFTINYEYLAWYLGHAPSKEKTSNVFMISDVNGEVRVRKL